MSNTDQTITVTLRIPESVYQQAAITAAKEQQAVEELLSARLIEGLTAHATVRSILELVAGQYRDRLQRENQFNQSPEQVLQKLRDIREQSANELYSR
jgi:gamma-glutamylcysteine synthetase